MPSYIKLAETGICTHNGRRRLAYTQWESRINAPPDRPLECFVQALLRRTEDVCTWSSREAAERDIDAAIRALQDAKDNLETMPPKEGTDG